MGASKLRGAGGGKMRDSANATVTEDAEMFKCHVVARRIATLGAARCAYVTVRGVGVRARRATPMGVCEGRWGECAECPGRQLGRWA